MYLKQKTAFLAVSYTTNDGYWSNGCAVIEWGRPASRFAARYHL